MTPRSRIFFSRLLLSALVVFFIVGGIGNLFPSDSVRADYERWGYPRWFHFLTGGLELLVALLSARLGTRLAGLLLGCVTMLAALATLMLHRELDHAIAPAVVMVFLSASIWFHIRKPINS